MSIFGASTEELAAWRDQTVSRAFIGWLEGQVEMYRRQIPEYIVKNKLDEARAATGALKGYEEILEAVTMTDTKVEAEPEEAFTDPATRLSLRKAT